MPNPVRKDLEAYRGDPYSYRLNFWDTTVDPVELMDLTGKTYAAQVRETPDSIYYVSFTIDHSHLADGWILLTLTDTQTADMAEENWWDLEEDGITLLRGKFTVERDVTR